MAEKFGKKKIRRLTIVILLLVFLLHNDLWWWHSNEFVLGLPVGLMYHILYCFAAALLFLVLVKLAWPRHLEMEPNDTPRS